MASTPTADLEVDIKADPGKAVIEGKTSVPFKTFVMLVLQRKVTILFEKWGKNPVIIDSELLTSLASAPQDSMENKGQLVLVTLGVGMLTGVFCFALMQAALLFLEISLGQTELFLTAGSLVGLAFLTVVLSRIQRRKRTEKVVEVMERVASLLPKK